MTPAQLQILVKDAIAPLIGTYKNKAGFSYPAISVGNPINDLTVSGIEIIIPNFPLVTKSNLTATVVHRNERWKIVLIRHDEDKAKWFTAIDKLHHYFPRTFGLEIPQGNIANTRPQYNLTFIHDCGREI